MRVENAQARADALGDGVVVHDPGTGEILAINDAYCEMLGREEADILGDPVSSLSPDGRSYADREGEWIPRPGGAGVVRFEWRNLTAAGDVLPVEVTLSVGERDGTKLAVASVRERPGRGERREELRRARDRYEALFENDQLAFWEFDLSEAKRRADRIAEHTDDLASYLESEPERLQRVFEAVEVTDVNERAVDFYGADSKEHLREGLDELLTEDAIASWRRLMAAVADGETSFRTECTARTFDGGLRVVLSELVVPEAHAEDYSRVYLTALDVTERKERRRELEAALDARSALQETLTDATSVEDFAEAVCAELTAIDDVALARVESVTPDGVESLASAGESRPVETGPDDEHPATVAVRERRTRVAATDGREGRTEASRGDGPVTTEVMAVPIAHDGVTRGALVAHLTDGRSLGTGRVEDLLEESADVLGYAMGSEKRRRALSAGDHVELTVEVETRETPLSRAAAAAGTTAGVTAAIPRDGDSVLCYLAVDDAAAFLGAARATDGVDDPRRVDDDSRVQLVTSGPVPAAVVAEHGGIVTESTVDAATTTVRARFPRGTAFDPVLDALDSRFGEVATMEYTSDPAETDRSTACDPPPEMTDRQKQVLEAAYRAGYFEKPRRQNAGEVADGLGVSRPAYDEVLRAAQRNLLSELFDGE